MSKIAIVGGGIGGLVSAIALKQAGRDVQVYERAPEFGEIGAGLSLSPNAVKGLESLGFADDLAAECNEPEFQFNNHGETGEVLVKIDRRDTRETYGAPYYQIHRADFLDMVLDHVGGNVCEGGKTLTSLDQDDNGVALHFADGSSAHADVVIAADGLRSTVRDALFDPEPPQFSGHSAWRALIPAERLDERYVARTNVNHVGPGKNLLTYPVRGKALVNIVGLSQSKEWVEESWSAQAEPEELAAKFAGWCEWVTTAIGAIRSGELARWGLFIRKPLDSWLKGRVLLIGDAAHPMLPYMGQGASSAIEDATVIGRCFAAEDDPVKAMALFEATRLERAAFLQAESNVGGERLQSLNPYVLRDNPPRNEDSLGIFRYDPATAPLGEAVSAY